MGPKLLPPASSDGHPVGPHPLVVQSLSSHHVEKCIACDPGDHPRQWTHPPAGSPPRHRNIVLCFDGTRDSFSKDHKEAYHIQPDRAEDIISFFGFSRGATRALAGMIHEVGLLPRCNLEQLPFAYDMYRRDGKEGRELSRIFKKTLSIGVKMKFIGAWYVVRLSVDSYFMSPPGTP